MKIVKLIQSTPEWHQHRAQHLNASDTPAMLGCSSYKTRAELVHEVATGLVPEVDAATQKRFDDGHRYEALARPLAEKIVGDELYPCVGTEGKFSASFDGITLLEETIFEHKSLNDALRAVMRDGCRGQDLPLQYRAQMEHQLMVSGADRALFMASKWEGSELVEELHTWYMPDPELRARIVAGWEQFEADVSAFEPTPARAEPVAAPIAGFGALTIRVEGRVIASNMDAFKANAEAFLAQLPRAEQLQTDQDFVDAEAAVKACSEAEARIKAATESTLGEMVDIDALLRTAGSVSEAIRAARLVLEKAVKAEKENRRAQIVAAGANAVRAHFDSINASLGQHRIQPVQSLQLDLAAVIKGKKSLSSMQDAVSTAVANLKIEASQQADRVRANVAILDQHQQHASLFADRVQLCATKAPDDLRNLVAARISEHEAREAERLERERERIRQEEAARVEREQREVQARQQREEEQRQRQAEEDARAEQRRQESEIAEAAEAVEKAVAPAAGTATPAAHAPVAADRPGARINLGEINAAIAPLKIDAGGLAELGFTPVATDRASKLFDAGQLDAMKLAMIRSLQRVRGAVPRAA